MCCDEEIKVSEDIRVIHDELEKADTWIFAAQEILRPENEEFDPDLKDIGNIEVVLSFAIANLNEAITLCQIYRAGKDETPQDELKVGVYKGTPFLNEDLLVKMKKEMSNLNPPIVDLNDIKFHEDLNAIKLHETQEALVELEKKLNFLKANVAVQRMKLTPEELKLYKDRD